MKIETLPLPAKFGGRRTSGVALVLTLSLIVVATVIVTAFFFRSRFDSQGSASYTSQVTAAQLAELGSAKVVASLINEAEEGSVGIGSGNDRVLVANDRENMVPERYTLISAAADPNSGYAALVKQSIPGLPGFQVSNSSTYDTSLTSKSNYRPLDKIFWSKPMLTATDFGDTEVPNWVYVNASGKDVSTAPGTNASPEEKIAGRFAFNVYEVGGLLDINAAGFESGAGDLVKRKGSLIFADLNVLASAANVSLSGSTITNLNNWRYRNMTWNPTSNGEPSEQLAELLRSGPMLASLGKFPAGVEPGVGRLQQNAFLSRADAIRFFTTEIGEGETRKLMPYLTHFTRDVNKPTFTWDWDEGRPTPSKSWNLIGAVSASGGTPVTPQMATKDLNPPPWVDSGAGEGRMRLTRRFPLEKLELLRMNDGAPVGDAGEIERYFGLKWVSSGDWPHWEYVSKGTNANQPLRKLSEISPDDAEDPNKQPDFFEVLLAAINSGSLGQQLGGVAGTQSSGLSPWLGRPHGYNRDDGRVDLHVMRIGAAIIDQWDTDGYPTEIAFGGQSVFGVEDMPYLHGFKRISYWGIPEYKLGGRDVVESAMLMHPQVWNPHSRNSGEPLNGKPTKFRVVPYTNQLHGSSKNPLVRVYQYGWGTDFGRNPRFAPYNNASCNGSWRYYEFPGGTNAPESGNWDKLNNYLTQDSDYLEFADSDGETFREPILLWKPNSSSPVSGKSVTVTPSMSNQAVTFSAQSLTWTDQNPSGLYTGFRVGKFLSEKPPGTNGQQGTSQVVPIQYLQNQNNQVRSNFALQYEGPNGWQTYDIMYDTVDFDNNAAWGINKKVWRIVGREADATFRVDPRVERFGPQSQWYRVTAPNQLNQIVKFPPNSTGMADGTNTILSSISGNSQFWNFYSTTNSGLDDVYMAYNVIPTAASNPLPNAVKNANAAMWTYYMPTSIAERGNQWLTTADNRAMTAPNAARAFVTYIDPDQQRRLASSGWSNGEDFNPVKPGNDAARPIVLNRPFQSVAEMGYACRDLPWKSLDFWSRNSGDAALLDYFSLYESDPDLESDQLIVGTLNLNTANPAVLASVIAGTGLESSTAQIDESTARDIADAIKTWTTTKGPFRSRGEIVGSWDGSDYVSPLDQTGGGSPSIGSLLGDHGRMDVRRTSLLRALVDTSTVRTWNLMIDVTAQAGRVPAEGGLDDFSMEGQARYWVFVAIDRFTGKVVDQRVEIAD